MKIKGVSVQSIIIGSVITGVIAAAGLAALWPSVEKAKINAERVSINEVSNALTSTMEERMAGVTFVDAAVTTEMKQRVAALPSYFTYYIGAENTADVNSNATYLLAYADSNDTAAVQRLKDVVSALDTQFDGAVDGTAGKFRFDTTCDGTGACHYAVHLADLGLDSGAFGVSLPTAPITGDTVGSAANLGTAGISQMAMN
jgi:hypothetical protein